MCLLNWLAIGDRVLSHLQVDVTLSSVNKFPLGRVHANNELAG